jgi:hypothetical protein
MARIEPVIISNRDTQTSDTAVYRKDLPRVGSVSAIDVGIRVTNGSTKSEDKDLLEAIKKISLVADGNNYLVHVSGPELFRHHWLKFGSPLPHHWTEEGSGVRECWFRLPFGRYLGDPEVGLMLDRFANVQLQIDYDLPTAYGAAGSTTFTTGTFTPTVIMHQFPMASRPSFRYLLGLREIWSGTSSSSGELIQDLPSVSPIAAIDVFALKDATAEGSVITDVRVGKDNFTTQWVNQKWYNLQYLNNLDLKENLETFTLVTDTDDTRDVHLSNIVSAVLNSRTFTKWVSGSTAGVQPVPLMTSAVGNRVTIGGHTYTTAANGAAVTGAAMSGAVVDMVVRGDVHGAVRIPFVSNDAIDTPLTPDVLKTAQIGLTQGASGGTLGIVVEEVHRY